MLEQELKNIWQGSSKTAQISIKTQQLIEEFDLRLAEVQKHIRQRDIREIAASFFGIVIFSFFAYAIPFPLTQFSCYLSILWFVFVIFRFWKSKKQNSIESLSLSLSEQLAYKKQLMLKQVKLLDSAAYWYAGPSFITNFLFILGLGNPIDYQWDNPIAARLLPLSLNGKIVTLTGLFIFYLFIVWLNKKAARTDLKPILENIETIEKDLEAQD
tara:strand:- start:3493 stop:4134 length:642 start_codon:yes stop_codon:yes gene_type:complete